MIVFLFILWVGRVPVVGTFTCAGDATPSKASLEGFFFFFAMLDVKRSGSHLGKEGA